MGLLTGINNNRYSQHTSDQFVGNGVATTFTLTKTPISTSSLIVTIDGVKQHSNTFTLSGSQIIFSEVIPTGSAIEVTTLSSVGVANVTPDNSVTSAKIVDANVTTIKIADANVTTAKIADAAVTEPKFSGFFLNNPGVQSGVNFNTTTPNSIGYVTGPYTNDPSYLDRSGMLMHLSSSGHGTDAANSRDIQLLGLDTDGGGLYFRAKQGTSGWANWNKITNDVAWKEGPTSYNTTYKNNWWRGDGRGECLDATSDSGGIYIRESGFYYILAYQRITTAGGMIGIGVNGDRAVIESRVGNLWGHDHSGDGASEWSQSICVGNLQAGWLITSGPPSNGSVGYASAGHTGGLIMWRMS